MFGDHRHELANSAPFVGDLGIDGMSDKTLRRYVRLLDSSVVRVNSVDGNGRLCTLFRGRRLQVERDRRCQLARAQFPLPARVTSRGGGASSGLSNGCFYEGVCQAPLNSDVQWFSGLSPRDTVVVTSLSMIRLQVLACR